MNNLYTSDGWINAKQPLKSKAPFTILIGGRGIGKTYGILKELLTELKEPFIYLRRTQVQIDACKTQELSPFSAIAKDYGLIVESSSISKYVAGFTKIDGEEKSLVAIGIALSTFANVRGFDASGYNYIVFDEFIPEKHERPIPHEGEAFLNVLETINRNRELKGQDPVKVVMISNANKLDSPILASIGALKPIDKMIRSDNDRATFYDGDLEIFRYINSPISERKKNSALYRLSKSKDFSDMALENSFGEETYRNVKSLPLQEFTAIAATAGITVLRHKSNGTYYVVPGVKSEKTYSSTPGQRREFCRRTYSSYEAWCKNKVYFATIESKVIFEQIWR